MTEHGYIRSVHTQICKTPTYIWKINDPYQGGVADAYYSLASDMWVEYKYLQSLPKRETTEVRIDLSVLQKEWLRARHREGRTVAVIIGSPIGSLICPGLSWDRVITTADFISSMVDKNAVVRYILTTVEAHR